MTDYIAMTRIFHNNKAYEEGEVIPGLPEISATILLSSGYIKEIPAKKQQLRKKQEDVNGEDRPDSD